MYFIFKGQQIKDILLIFFVKYQNRKQEISKSSYVFIYYEPVYDMFCQSYESINVLEYLYVNLLNKG